MVACMESWNMWQVSENKYASCALLLLFMYV
jgi:hypothetical protein